MNEGSIDHNVRLAISLGMPPIIAYRLATINAAECFGLGDRGAIVPGFKADLLILNEFESVSIACVYKEGKLIVENGCVVNFPKPISTTSRNKLTNSVRFHDLTEADFQIRLKNRKANIIEIIPNSLITRHIIEEVMVDEDKQFQTSTEKDLIKIAVVERHHMTKHIGLGIVKGLGLKSGAIATTVAHDSHNLILAGTNDADLLFAAKEMKKMQGGLIVVENGRILASLELPIAGLLSDQPYQEVNVNLQAINNAVTRLGASDLFNPFLTLSFLALPVIPELKITDIGLFDVKKFKHIEVSY